MTPVTLLGFTIKNSMFYRVQEKDENLSIQTHKFAWSLARALRYAGCSVYLLSSHPVSNFPKMRRIFFRKKAFCEDDFSGRTLSFINLLGLKHITRLVSCLMSLYQDTHLKRSKIIFVHGVHSPFLFFAVLMKTFYKKVVVVMTDPPGLTTQTDNYIIRLVKKFDRLVVTFLIKKMDGVIGLTSKIIEDYAPDNKNLILNGFMDCVLDVPIVGNDNNLSNKSGDKPSRPFRIAYAGTLCEEYGVQLLIDAVLKINEFDVELILFGKGALVANIQKLALINKKIIYGGMLNTKDLISQIVQVDLIVNPRPSHQFFVQYSFPSKLIESMGLGVPVLTTRLPDIPSGCFDHLFFAEDETVSGFKQSIIDTYNCPTSVRIYKVNSARQFVVDNYSEKKQGERLASFIRSLDL